ncbi:L-idonate 5-dehydrogenase [Telmatospirillum sp.]|uniref:L-idonate 5-dehydrogenase n=1 Tax=Telmatospirillum sp. TaxID=2079197 RepID=UPI00284CB67B|nr:L-idonate 5-dehydrogenase [Telmatospirillum sp.]MDR3437383.1 L-idonate 5-dehydrogenase [Telmatospirillum sp.]
MMRAVVVHAPRDLRIEQIAAAAPGPGEVCVRLAAGGICGSDLHYYQDGGFGTVRIKEPMILGHEAAGTVSALGEGVATLKVGDKVAINPSKPCGHCRFCIEGHREQCLDMRFFGSAMRFPHMQGIFRDEMVVDAAQACPVGPDTPLEEAAFAEPLSVALHAVTQAGSLIGKRVLVTGSGTIGCLVAIAARHAGAREIVGTDISDPALAMAKKVAADRTLNVASDPQALSVFAAEKGYFDVAFECTGNGRVLAGLPEVVRPRGTIILIGLGGESTLLASQLVTKEIGLFGSFRFDAEFSWAADLLARRAVDVRPLLTASFPLDRAVDAFELAGDRAHAMKVQLSFVK